MAMIAHQSGVGAIIANDQGEIVRSANVLPPQLNPLSSGADGIEETDRYFVIEHAERAAVFKALVAGHSLVSATIYCTRFPCSDCARAIIWAGIGRAVFPTGFAGENRWLETQRAALRMLRHAGIKVRYLGTNIAG